ncbi:uncharacterized protein [Diabrotica undecimpunctata]|uniref:uncharacterized protein n=1 Tax=Diabrotica undecimpunctata TaxID=50387 RepID=UPI003B63E5C2
MLFIIPDNILETLLCSFCHKYLSVKPVKVYPNRLIQCGRCDNNEEQSTHKSEGVESLYGAIAENILFKCVNRFDGCRELLKYSQVWDHEQACLVKLHKCPICYEEMASFLMLRHFHYKHKNAILDCPAFVFNLNDLLEMPSGYIYQEEDNLFFLYISYSQSENTIKLGLVCMASYKLAENIYHQFTLSSEKKEFDIVMNPKSCNNDFFVVDISHMSNLIHIKFKLFDRNLKVLASSEVSNSVVKPVPKKQNPLAKMLLHGNQIKEYQTEVNLKCIECEVYCFLLVSTLKVNTCFIDKDNNCICYNCYQWLKSMYSHYFERRFSNEIIDKMKFSMWNCSTCCSDFKPLDRVLSHTINCKLARQFSCPIKNCCEKGTADKMIEHLKIHNCLAFLSPFKLTLNSSSCYVFVEKYIVFLHITRSGHFICSDNIQAELVTKTDNDKKETTLKPYAIFFNNDYNAILNNSLVDLNRGIFVKVFVLSNVFN